MSELKSLFEKRNRLLEEQKDIIAQSKKAGREVLNKEEEDKFNRIEADYASCDSMIEKLSKIEKREAEESAEIIREKTAEANGFKDVESFDKAKNQAFASYILKGAGISESEKSILKTMWNYNTKATDPQTTSDAAGGYAIPTGFQAEIMKTMTEISQIRNFARVITTKTGNTMDWPGVNDTAQSGSIHTEATANAILTVPFTTRTLSSYTYTSDIVKLSIELLQDSAIPLEALMGELLGDRLGRATNLAYTTGNGSTAPQGCVTGATEASYVASGAGSVTVTTFINAKHSVNNYHRNSKKFAFMMNDDTLRRAKLLTIASGDDRPLWQASRAVGEPSTIDGTPYIINHDMPSVGTNTNKWLLVGDFNKFVIRDVQGMNLFRFNELYMDGLAIGFQAWLRTDSKVIDSTAIKYVYDPAT